MASILPFSKEEDAFGPQDLRAMSMAFEDVCEALSLPADAATTRELIAVRIIELAKRGERSPTRLRDQLLIEADSFLAGNLDRKLLKGV
jgi:hypothetical protein